jgi:hypothetical protein
MIIETNTIIAIIAICKNLHFCDNREGFMAIIAIWSLIQGSKDHPGARLEAQPGACRLILEPRRLTLGPVRRTLEPYMLMEQWMLMEPESLTTAPWRHISGAV